MQRPLPNRLFYSACHVLVRLLAATFFQIRCDGRQHIPASGGALVCANHQSNLDPMLIGLASDRPLNFLARRTLFGFAPFRWLSETLNAIPVDRDGFSFSGMRTAVQRLRAGEVVVVFPEGTRTRDGEVASLKPGVSLLIRRAAVPLIPIGIAGAYEAWPRSRRLPRPTPMHVCIGAPLAPEQTATLSDEELVGELERRLRACHASARAARRAMMGRLDRGAVAQRA